MAKALEAKVRDDSRLPTVTAFGGREYVRGEWRPVPPEQADSAAAHPMLEVRAAGEVVVEEAVDIVDVVEEPPAPETDTDMETDKAAPPAPLKAKKRGQL